jgi:hypothetical protein
MMDRDHFTLVFQGDIGRYKENPLMAQLIPYGQPIAAGRGHAFDEADVLRDALDRIQAILAPVDDARHVETVGRAREIARESLELEA